LTVRTITLDQAMAIHHHMCTKCEQCSLNTGTASNALYICALLRHGIVVSSSAIKSVPMNDSPAYPAFDGKRFGIQPDWPPLASPFRCTEVGSWLWQCSSLDAPCRPSLQAPQAVRTVLKEILLHHSWVATYFWRDSLANFHREAFAVHRVAITVTVICI
jgi:hypothetical protein